MEAKCLILYIPVVALGSGEGSVIRTITPHMMAVRPTFTGKTYQGEIKAKRKHLERIGKKSGDKFCSFPLFTLMVVGTIIWSQL